MEMGRDGMIEEREGGRYKSKMRRYKREDLKRENESVKRYQKDQMLSRIQFG